MHFRISNKFFRASSSVTAILGSSLSKSSTNIKKALSVTPLRFSSTSPVRKVSRLSFAFRILPWELPAENTCPSSSSLCSLVTFTKSSATLEKIFRQFFRLSFLCSTFCLCTSFSKCSSIWAIRLITSFLTACSQSFSKNSSQVFSQIGSYRSWGGSVSLQRQFSRIFIKEDFPLPHSPCKAMVTGVSQLLIKSHSALTYLSIPNSSCSSVSTGISLYSTAAPPIVRQTLRHPSFSYI